MQRLRLHDLPFHMFVYLLSHVYRDVYRDGFVDYCHNRLVGMNGSGQRRRDPPTDTEAYVCNVCGVVCHKRLWKLDAEAKRDHIRRLTEALQQEQHAARRYARLCGWRVWVACVGIGACE